MTTAKCYVYVYRVGGIVRYVGKGTGNRVMEHLKIANRINSKRATAEIARATHWQNCLAKALRDGIAVEITIDAENLTDAEARAKEIELIALYGRNCIGRGTLHNTLAGGNGLSSEDAKRMLSRPDVRARRSASLSIAFSRPDRRAHQSAMCRISHTNPEVLEKISKASLEAWSKDGAKARRSVSMKAAAAKPEEKARKSAAAKAVMSDPEVRARISAKVKQIWDHPEYRARLSAIHKARRAKRELFERGLAVVE